MKLKIGKNLTCSMFIGILYSLMSSQSHAGTMGPVLVNPLGKVYFGIFGGGGKSTRSNLSQFGTAFYTEANGGPLAVDAFGKTHRHSVGLVGGHVGYQWPAISFSLFNNAGFTPAAELEAYYLGRTKFKEHDLSNDTIRLDEHDFLVTYPLKTGVFLVNAVANINLCHLPRFHPYVGAGFGSALLSISHADAAQTSPPEIGINHYNSKTRNTDSVFAGQIKAGLSFDFNERVSLFGEYRWLYLANSNYAFGSTVYPGHPATTNWSVEFGAQHYNLGSAGIRISV